MWGWLYTKILRFKIGLIRILQLEMIIGRTVVGAWGPQTATTGKLLPLRRPTAPAAPAAPKSHPNSTWLDSMLLAMVFDRFCPKTVLVWEADQIEIKHVYAGAQHQGGEQRPERNEKEIKEPTCFPGHQPDECRQAGCRK